MPFKLKVSTDAAAISEMKGGGNFINKSGIYPVTINFASLELTTNGAEQVNFNITYNGQESVIYGPIVTKKPVPPATEGDVNAPGQELMNRLFIILGAQEGDEPTIVTETHEVYDSASGGKKPREFAVIDELSGAEVKVWIQQEWKRNIKTRELKEGYAIKTFFRATDNATAEEIVNNKDLGKQHDIILEKYADNIAYLESTKGANDAPSKEEVQNYLENKSAARKAATPTATVNPGAKKLGFGKK